MEQQWNDTDRNNEVRVPLCPPQILNGLSWAQTQASAVRNQELTARAMA
jgi:hypothetical protein